MVVGTLRLRFRRGLRFRVGWLRQHGYYGAASVRPLAAKMDFRLCRAVYLAEGGEGALAGLSPMPEKGKVRKGRDKVSLSLPDLNPVRFYSSASIFALMASFEAAPTSLSFIWPPGLTNTTSGIFLTENFIARSLFWSTSHLPMTTLPSYSSASSSMMGVSERHGPHHSAQKSITKGLPEATSSS